MNIHQKGANPEKESLFPNGNLDEIEFMATAGETYVIEVLDQAYGIRDGWLENETVCTNVIIDYQ